MSKDEGYKESVNAHLTMGKHLLLIVVFVQAAVLVNMTRFWTISEGYTDNVRTKNSPSGDLTNYEQMKNYLQTDKPIHLLRRLFRENQENGCRRSGNRVSIKIEGQKLKKLMNKTRKVTTDLYLTEKNALIMEVKWFNRMY